MGIYINSQYDCAWKYPGERELYRLPEEFDIGKEVDNSDLEEDGNEVYGVVISVAEIDKMEKLALELGNNMHYKELHSIAKDALLKEIEKQSSDWKNSNKEVMENIQRSKEFKDFSHWSVKKLDITKIYEEAIASHLEDEEDCWFVLMLWSIIEHMREFKNKAESGKIGFEEQDCVGSSIY